MGRTGSATKRGYGMFQQGSCFCGAVKIEVNQTYPLAEAAQAHRDLEARKTTGSTIFVP